MVRLAFILVGGRALCRRWWVPAVVGSALVLLAALILTDAMDGAMSVAVEVFGLVFLFEGALGLVASLSFPGHASRAFAVARSLLLLVVGFLILDFPVPNNLALASLFALGFFLDGVTRAVTAAVVRFARWPIMVAAGIAEVVLAGLIITSWPLPHTLNVPVCMSLLMLLSGWVLLRASLMLRSHPREVAILALPLFGDRSWYENAPVLLDDIDLPKARDEGPLTVYVWTPVGSADVRERRVLIDRYVAAVDASGAISTGHAALELKPDVYISHYPAQDIDRSSDDFAKILRAGAENNVEGRFLPSYAVESAQWCEADASVAFTRFDGRRLRAYWAGYRQENTYNLTNRNCSVAVSAGLDSALEGALASRYPWLRIGALLLNPDMWAAAYIRSRANAMSWTPGLVLDYARTLKRIIEPAQPSWFIRLSEFARRVLAAPNPGPDRPGPESPVPDSTVRERPPL